MSSFLVQYTDPALEVNLDRRPEDFELAEIQRIQDSAVAIMFAMTIPRRIGEATSEELALDKKRCKRVLHVLRQSYMAWSNRGETGDWRPPTTADKQRGAALNWQEWYEETQIHLTNLRSYLATYGMKQNGDWAKKAVTRVNNELSWLAYAMR